jgi:P-type E1-E2 ATPase
LLRKGKWSEIEVGDLVLVEKNHRIPADLLLLKSSEPKGEAFIETSTLDGEKHLKPKESLKQLKDKITIFSSGDSAENKTVDPGKPIEGYGVKRAASEP